MQIVVIGRDVLRCIDEVTLIKKLHQYFLQFLYRSYKKALPLFSTILLIMKRLRLIVHFRHWFEKLLMYIDEKLGGQSSTQMQAGRWDKDK